MMMEKFRDIFKGQTIWIVGKGPSLQYLKRKDIGSGPVITINQSIIKIEELGLPNPIYSMQKDGGNRKRWKRNPHCDHKSSCGNSCGNMVRPKRATLLVHKHESFYCFADYSPRYVFDWIKLGLVRNTISLTIAIKIGILMGCKKFHFMSFDAHVFGKERRQEYVPNVGVLRITPSYHRQQRWVKPFLKDLDCEWFTPEK